MPGYPLNKRKMPPSIKDIIKTTPLSSEELALNKAVLHPGTVIRQDSTTLEFFRENSKRVELEGSGKGFLILTNDAIYFVPKVGGWSVFSVQHVLTLLVARGPLRAPP